MAWTTGPLSGATADERRKHQRLKEHWRPIVAAGQARCQQGISGNGSSGTCLHPTRQIRPGEHWALGHNDARTAWIGPVHADCNLHDAASRGGIARAKIYGPYRGDGRSIHPRRIAAARQTELRICEICKTLFQPAAQNERACSRDCKRRRASQQAREWKMANRDRVREHQTRWKAKDPERHARYMRERRKSLDL